MKLHPRKLSDLILNLDWKEKNMPETENHIKAQKKAQSWIGEVFPKLPKAFFFATLYVDRKHTETDDGVDQSSTYETWKIRFS